MFVTSAWSSRVGRRLALAVLVAATIPLALAGWFVTSRARGELERAGREQLRDEAKALALNGFERLHMVEEKLRALQRSDLGQGEGADGLDALHEWEAVDAVALRETPAAIPAVVGGQSTPPPEAFSEPWLTDGRAEVIVDDQRQSWMAVGDTNGGLVIARLDLAVVFGFGEQSRLGVGDRVCLLDAESLPLACVNQDAALIQALAAVRVPLHGEGTLIVDGTDYLVRTWSLPTAAKYRIQSMSLAMLTPRAEVLAPVKSLSRDLVFLTLAALLTVVLTVFGVVGRLLRPLAALGAAADRARTLDYDVTLEIRTGDEFEMLANGFESMLGAIRTHVNDLEASAVGSATALARTIDAKSPWTAGHSERATAVALQIGRRLGLSTGDLDVLQRGGLLHDIGKLGTPIDILDKPGRPTPEERLEIERHPEAGVRILEPIAAFVPLLPLVLEHHERFDGTGYPHRKQGYQIHRLARVLAVADVYDAMRSSRPYRAGMPRQQVLDYIQAESGRHFDPEMVEAFVAMMAAAGDAGLYDDDVGAASRRGSPGQPGAVTRQLELRQTA